MSIFINKYDALMFVSLVAMTTEITSDSLVDMTTNIYGYLCYDSNINAFCFFLKTKMTIIMENLMDNNGRWK